MALVHLSVITLGSTAKVQSILKLLPSSEKHVIVNIPVLLCPRKEERKVVGLLGRFIFQEISFPCTPILVNPSEGKSRPVANKCVVLCAQSKVLHRVAT